jgi:hypothetical protein
VTRRTSAKVAGAAYLVYTVVGFGTEVLMHQARGIEADPARLARMAEYVRDLRLAIVCTLLECLSALVLAVSLYGITRDEDQELALMGMSCRVVEGVLGTFIIRSYSGMLWLATSATGESHSPTADALRASLLVPGPNVPVGSIFFAVGSTIFSFLLLRGRMVPVSIAWLGVVASGLLAATLPIQLAGISTGPLSGYAQWLPALAFQLVLAPWLLVKGAATPRRSSA